MPFLLRYRWKKFEYKTENDWHCYGNVYESIEDVEESAKRLWAGDREIVVHVATLEGIQFLRDIPDPRIAEEAARIDAAKDAERAFYESAEKEYCKPMLAAKSLPEALGVEQIYTPETIAMMEDAAARMEWAELDARREQERDELEQDAADYDEHHRELNREYLRMVSETF